MKTLRKDSIREIKNTSKRFLSILLIVLLGVGFFAGIKAASPDMKKTVSQYFNQNNVMDIEVISTLGLTKEDIEEIKNIEQVAEVEGSYTADALITSNEIETVVKINTIGSTLNQVELVEGKLPEKQDECVVEPDFLKGTDKKIGDKITLEIPNTDTQENVLKQKEVKIVGTIQSPLYISRERGSTKLASGKISYYLLLPEENINSNIYTEIYLTVKKEKTESSFSKSYEQKVEAVKEEINEIADQRKEARYQSLRKEAEEKVAEAQEELDKNKKEAESQIEDAKNQLQKGKQDLEDGQKKIQQSEKEIQENEKKAQKQFQEAEKQLQQAKQQLDTKEQQLQQKEKEYIDKKQEAEQVITQMELGIEQIEKKIQELEIQKQQLEQVGADTTQIEIAIQQAKKSKGILEEQKRTVEQQLVEATQQLATGRQQIENGKKEITSQTKVLKNTKETTTNKIANVKKQIEKAKTELINGKKEIEEGERQLTEKQIEAEEKIREAQNKIEEAKDKINEIKRPDWYVLTRNENVGYASYSQDAERIANIGKVFPVVFFVVAALISLTSMTRMVEEQRTQIGTLKALGYSKIQIAGKYALYASLATIVGGIAGMLIGFNMLPKIIFNMYAMMYTLPPIILEFNVEYALTGMIIALLCTTGATIVSCISELKSTPAMLMRPKAPKVGKRVLLERISIIWSHLKFTQKVTVRNIFRYKKRFLMTIIGILGCTSLMVAGFGLRDSVSRMIPSQYGEVFKYGLAINFKDEAKREEIAKGIENITKLEGIEKTAKVNMQAVEILDKNNKQEMQLIVPENAEDFTNYITLENRKTKEKYRLKEDGVILTEKIANLLSIKQGETIKIKNADDKIAEVKVTGITKNYLMHYMYMSSDCYEKIYGESVKYNAALSLTKESLTKEEEENLTKQMLQDENISKVSFTSSTQSLFADIMDNMNFVVWILIVSAGLLAFVVLYNLANVNISERIRELATIKVLGFYDNEVYRYVSRETVILTVIGIAFGLIAGYILNIFIIKTCELDILMFDSRVHMTSYLYSSILTVFFTIIVNIATYFSLKKINMIDSLKSIE